MTKEETLTLLKMIKAAWPTFKLTEENVSETVNAWESALRGCSFDDCRRALKRCQNPKDGEEAKRFAYAPVPGTIYAFVKEIEDERISVSTEVSSCARRAVDNFPSNGEEERRDGKNLFYDRCMAQPNPSKAAFALEEELNSLCKKAQEYKDEETGEDYVKYLKPVTEIISEYTFT